MSASSATARRSEAGFTLVELMVVVAIIALIAGIIIPNYVHAREQAAVSDSQAKLKQIATALELYFSDHQDYPQADNAHVAPTLFGGPVNPYMNSAPTTSQGHSPFVYTYQTASGGGAPSYQVSDPTTYGATSLSNISLGPYATETQRTCRDSGTCAHINYSPQYGIFGS